MATLNSRANLDLATRIKAKRDEATALENERGLSARQATDNMAKARQLRQDAAAMERHDHGTQMWLNMRQQELQLEDAQAQQAVQAEFSAIQNELVGMEDAHKEAVADAMNRVVYQGAIGIDRRTLERQVSKLLNGEGMSDDKGRRYLNFQEGSNSAVYRAYLDPAGNVAFVLASRGDSE